MAEHIEREATIKRIEEAYCADCNSYNGVRCRACGTGDAIDMIEDAPAADVAPVVHGQWEQVKKWATKAKYRCSVCGREIMSAVKVNIEKYPYCHCGAKMDGGDNTER